MLQQALEQLLAAVQQKAPQLSSEDATKVVNNLLVWMSESLDGLPEFRDIVEGLEYDKIEAEWEDKQPKPWWEDPKKFAEWNTQRRKRGYPIEEASCDK